MPPIPGFGFLAGVVSRARSLFRGLRSRSAVEAEMSEEFRLHIAMRTDDLMRDGLSRREASRPKVPAIYGLKKDSPLLPWSYVSDRMAAAKHYWLVTMSASGWADARPIDGIWLDEKFWFGGSPEARWRGEQRVDVVLAHGSRLAQRAPGRVGWFLRRNDARPYFGRLRRRRRFLFGGGSRRWRRWRVRNGWHVRCRRL